MFYFTCNESKITRKIELFHDILIYWDAPVCMAYVWIDAKSLRQCICMHFRRTLYLWGYHIMLQFEYGFKVLFDVRP